MLPDLWTTYDLPVLIALVQRLEVNGDSRLDAAHLAVDGLERPHVEAALRRLSEHGYIVGMKTQMDYPVIVHRVTERALRVVGAWPSAEQLADRLLAALAEAAEHGSTEDERGRARRALDALRSAGRDVLVNAAGGALGGAALG